MLRCFHGKWSYVVRDELYVDGVMRLSECAEDISRSYLKRRTTSIYKLLRVGTNEISLLVYYILQAGELLAFEGVEWGYGIRSMHLQY